MRKPGSKGAPTAKAFKKAAKTARKRKWWMHSFQREWVALLTIFFFFLERDVICDILFLLIGIIYNYTKWVPVKEKPTTR